MEALTGKRGCVGNIIFYGKCKKLWNYLAFGKQ